ncbi:unnamed protein product, partial [Discosporangium mesarthrocarpum]
MMAFRHVVKVWDAWLCEGSKVLFRYGLALLKMYKKKLKALHLGPGQGSDWWAHVRDWTSGPDFVFEELQREAFSLRTKWGRPVSWALLGRFHDKNEAEAQSGDKQKHHQYDEREVEEERADGAQPFFWPPFQLTATFPPPLLLSDIPSRAKLVRWVPEILRHKRLRVVFTTEIHGYNLNLLYSHCRNIAPSLLVVEASNRAKFGGFCSHPWQVLAAQPHNAIFGNGQCFLFRLSPNPATFRWRADRGQDFVKQHAQKVFVDSGFHLPNMSLHRGSVPSLHRLSSTSKHQKGGGDPPAVSGNSHHGLGMGSRHGAGSRHRGLNKVDSFSSLSVHKRIVRNESFMMSTRDFIAMGVSPVTANCGLKLYDDPQRGFSDVCET